MKKLLLLLLSSIFIMSFSGCGMLEYYLPDLAEVIESDPNYSSSTQTSQTSSSSSSSSSNDDDEENDLDTITELDTSDMFTDRDLENEYDESQATYLTLLDTDITINSEGVYILSGELTDGQIIIEADDTAKIQIVLDNVSINCSNSAAIYIISADKVFITLADESENNLSVSGEYVSTDDNNVDGVIFSKCDTTFNGTGTLTITADYGNGIVCKDDLVFASGTYNITSANHGVSANDSIRITNSTFNIDSGKDGMQADNDEDGSKGYFYVESGVFNITSVADGLQASSCMQIDDGEFDITSGGGFVEILNDITMGEGSSGVQATDLLEYSMKSLKASTIIINGGTFNLSSYEDTIHSNGDLTMNGGDIYILTGDDGVHADYDLYINDGSIYIEEGYEGIEGDNITIDGGSIYVNVYDDAVNSSSSSGVLTINGGDIYLACQGDGVDSNGSFVMTGGNLVLDVSAIYTGGDGNVDVTNSITFTGGTITDENGTEIDPTSSTSSSMQSFSKFKR
ncbi:MAG: carbohydrate-binding domain-containing protein [Clostridia bacterium]